ncbi:hypothetical protein [Paractinoplanes toevensis]|uniref:Integrase n=1 Tax=Paractinoplanes toevensis TaxID=571911 RepID=A0A919W803_9ACTN|nr:hypothetical protein [Actinoplanes toevensis]GIM91311.1 hypothetical protein Ato02nite_031040 [Actinoplanes toevensis]
MPAATRRRRGPDGEADHAPSVRSAPWYCASWRRTRRGDTGACTGNFLTLGVAVAASTVWEILRAARIDPVPDRATTTWAQFLRLQGDALLAADFFETITLAGARLYILLNQRHLLYALREYEAFYNTHRPHQGIANARPLAPLPEPITAPDGRAHLNIRRRDRLGGILHEYEHAA